MSVAGPMSFESESCRRRLALGRRKRANGGCIRQSKWLSSAGAGVHLERAKIAIRFEEHDTHLHAIHSRQIIAHEALTFPRNWLSVECEVHRRTAAGATLSDAQAWYLSVQCGSVPLCTMLN
jgi:hypothetical protein